MEISVIIPTYGRPNSLAACLESLSQMQTLPLEWEVIVVDDGSPISSQEVLDRYQRRLPLHSYRVSHGGPASARNHGARIARGQFLAFLDDDCQVPRDWLQRVRQSLTANARSAVGGHTRNLLVENCYAAASQTLVDYLYQRWSHSDKQFFTSNNLLVPKDQFFEIGGFDERFTLAAAEDRDLASRWYHAGKPLVYEPQVLVFHYHSLNFRGFLRQHFNYGLGAWRFWRGRARARQSVLRLEPLRFYLGMLRFPWRRGEPAWKALRESSLIGLSQFANLAGFAMALLRARR